LEFALFAYSQLNNSLNNIILYEQIFVKTRRAKKMDKASKSSGEIYYVKIPVTVAKKANKIIEERGHTKNWFIKNGVAYFVSHYDEVMNWIKSQSESIVEST
jgi:hypothetical protein